MKSFSEEQVSQIAARSRALGVQRRREASTVLYSLASPERIEWCRYLAGKALTSARIDSTHAAEGKAATRAQR